MTPTSDPVRDAASTAPAARLLEDRAVRLYIALAAFFWALVVTYQIWRKRQG